MYGFTVWILAYVSSTASYKTVNQLPETSTTYYVSRQKSCWPLEDQNFISSVWENMLINSPFHILCWCLFDDGSLSQWKNALRSAHREPYYYTLWRALLIVRPPLAFPQAIKVGPFSISKPISFPHWRRGGFLHNTLLLSVCYYMNNKSNMSIRM